MTLQDAVATLPSWIGIWVNILAFGGIVLPAVLLIWPASRRAAICTLVASIASFIAVGQMYDMGGYTKLLGLPHVLFYTPAAIVLWHHLQNGAMSVWPRRVAWAVFIIICISLVFDYIDVLRYWAGNRAPIPGTI